MSCNHRRLVGDSKLQEHYEKIHNFSVAVSLNYECLQPSDQWAVQTGFEQLGQVQEGGAGLRSRSWQRKNTGEWRGGTEKKLNTKKEKRRHLNAEYSSSILETSLRRPNKIQMGLRHPHWIGDKFERNIVTQCFWICKTTGLCNTAVHARNFKTTVNVTRYPGIVLANPIRQLVTAQWNTTWSKQQTDHCKILS